jgi:hypothetical protein
VAIQNAGKMMGQNDGAKKFAARHSLEIVGDGIAGSVNRCNVTNA